MTLNVRLLGPPGIDRDGTAMTVRGHKAWAVLALLLLRSTRVARAELARLLFTDADDPLGALRWNLAQLRRALGQGSGLSGDPIGLELPPDADLDVEAWSSTALTGRHDSPEALPGELLAGMQFPGCPAFETWLTGERRRLAATAAALIREEALAAMVSGRYAAAVSLARQLVVADPLDEPHQVLLVQALTAAGDDDAAAEQVAAYTQLAVRELGIEVSEQVLSAAGRSPVAVRNRGADRATSQAQLDAGRSALAAGAFDAGLESLRRAVQSAVLSGGSELEIEASVVLGSALIHTVRGHDEEAAAVLHRAISRANACGIERSVAHAHRKLATIDLMAGRRNRAEAWFAHADELAGPDEDELAANAGWRAFNLTDMGRYSEALTQFARSLQAARSCGNVRQVAWSESGVGRVLLLRGQLVEAGAAFEGSVAHCRAERWTAFLSYPEALLAEVRRRTGALSEATDLLQHAWALAVQLNDPCWQGLSARGLALVAAAHGESEDALRWMRLAVRCVSASKEVNIWMQAFVRDGACQLLLDLRHADAEAAVDALAELAGRTAMPDMLARAHLYSHRLGRPGALEAARLTASGLNNPELAALLAGD